MSLSVRSEHANGFSCSWYHISHLRYLAVLLESFMSIASTSAVRGHAANIKFMSPVDAAEVIDDEDSESGSTANLYASVQQETVEEKRQRLQIALSSEFGMINDLIPRPFINATHESLGSGSCWINAALQSLFGSKVVQYYLRIVFQRLRSRESNRWSTAQDHIWHADSGATVEILRNGVAMGHDVPKDAQLAVTFMTTMLSCNHA